MCCHPSKEVFACGFQTGAVRVFHTPSTTLLAEHRSVQRGMHNFITKVNPVYTVVNSHSLLQPLLLVLLVLVLGRVTSASFPGFHFYFRGLGMRLSGLSNQCWCHGSHYGGHCISPSFLPLGSTKVWSQALCSPPWVTDSTVPPPPAPSPCTTLSSRTVRSCVS